MNNFAFLVVGLVAAVMTISFVCSRDNHNEQLVRYVPKPGYDTVYVVLDSVIVLRAISVYRSGDTLHISTVAQ